LSDRKVVLSGMRSTGRLHLGHYFGTLRNWVELQSATTAISSPPTGMR
jgi:tryptophanyl-tRNA synthetase